MNKVSIVLIMLMCLSGIVEADPPTKELTIYVSEMRPCVIIEEDEGTAGVTVSGFEIDLCNIICTELFGRNLIADWGFLPVEWSQIETGIANGEADMACSGLTIRSSRMEWCSFSMPTMNSGLGIMVLRDDGEGHILHAFNIMWDALKVPVLLFVVFVFFFAVILWWLERDDNPDNDENGISDSFFPGVFEAIYFCVVTCSTVGYGDYTPKKWPARAVVMALIFVGIIAFCNFTALLSASHVTEYIGEINGPEDLKGKVVLTQTGTTSVDYVTGLGAKPKTVGAIDSACDGLLLGRADAVVFDYPVLLHYVKANPEKVKLVGGMFDDQYYGIMLSKNSPLKDPIDMILMKLYEDGTYKMLYDKWF